jgi:predicted TPR repeat methyltransferase
MENVVAPTGFWISNEDEEHVFIPELSNEINQYATAHKITSVYDFGCGTGEYLKRLKEHNNEISATGFEGHQTEREFDNIVKADLSEELSLEPVDLVISIEVGEHIPKEYEKNFLDNIVNHSKKHIILSWAVEGQGGLGHVNCQNNDYIINQVEERGFKFDKDTTASMREKMPDLWIKNTVMVFTSK